jgi:hypothetical protein
MGAVTVHKDTIDLITTTFITGGTQNNKEISSFTKLMADTQADLFGQALWDQNYAAVYYQRTTDISVPEYSWQPVAELINEKLEIKHIIQIEKSRRYLQRNSDQHPAWEQSQAKQLLERLERAIKDTLDGWPLIPAHNNAAHCDYQGIETAIWDWRRENGFIVLEG